MKQTLSIGAAIFLAAGMATNADAARLSTKLEPNTLNSFEDQSREALVDIDGDGNLSVGDVFIGFLRIDDRVVPGSGVSIDNQELYAAFSLQVTEFFDAGGGALSGIRFGSSTVAGLQLADITGDAARSATDLAAVYSDIGTNLIGVNTTAGQNDILTQTTEVSNGTFELALGLVQGDDFFETVGSGVTSLATGGLAQLFNATFGLGFGSNTIAAGLTISEQSFGTDFEDNSVFVASETNGLSAHQLTLSGGSLSGACDLYNTSGDDDCGPPDFNGVVASSNFLFGTIAAAGQQYDYYGISNNLDVNVFPVPAPAPLALLGASLIGLAALRRRRMS